MKKIYKVTYWYYACKDFDGGQFDERIFNSYSEFRAWVRDWKDAPNVNFICDNKYMACYQVLLKKAGVEYDF